MKMLHVAFDCDGTLLKASDDKTDHPRAREKIRTMLIALSECDNVLIHVWSAGGEAHARQTVTDLALVDYVDSCGDKPIKDEKGKLVQTSDFKPDIAFDDLDDAAFADVMIIVKESNG